MLAKKISHVYISMQICPLVNIFKFFFRQINQVLIIWSGWIS